MAKKLTRKQELFVAEYLIDLNATRAAVRAGYSPKTAYSQGQRVLRNVEIHKAIQAAMDKRAEKLEITADRVLKEIAKLAFFDVRKLFNSDGSPKQICELDDDTAYSGRCGQVIPLDVGT
jgi:phage terminase small subunit